MVLAHADIAAGVNLGAALADENPSESRPLREEPPAFL
jgi:hypothetical protein